MLAFLNTTIGLYWLTSYSFSLSFLLLSRFDPERYNPEKMKHKLPLTFEPFGFGKRRCPGYRFSYVEVTVMLSILMRRFKFHLVEDIDVGYVHGLVTQPDRDIFITISKRE